MAKSWEFLETWAKENVHGILFGDEETARQLAKNCVEAAKNAGITEAELTKAAGGDLSDFFLSELETAANAEERRLAEKDKR